MAVRTAEHSDWLELSGTRNSVGVGGPARDGATLVSAPG